MAKAAPKTEAEVVDAHIAGLDPSIATAVDFIRRVILSSGKVIGERIKWNNPSFYYTGTLNDEDPGEYPMEIAVFNLFKNRMMLVFPSGARVDDGSGFLSGVHADGRRLIVFADIEDARSRETKLSSLILAWPDGVEK